MSQKLTSQEINELDTSLHYCKVDELKTICDQLNILPKGQKAHLIASIMHFIKSGKQLSQKTIPTSSRKQLGKNYPLAPDTHITYGDFKNDLATRMFLKN